MLITDLLKIDRGITSLIGGGGKTSLLYLLADELSRTGRVIVCTSTHIRIPARFPLVAGNAESISSALRNHPVICAGTPCENGKLTAPLPSFDELSVLADYVLVEADGSRGLPMKAHAPHEPVIPPGTGDVILVVGSQGFGLPVFQACHRPERWADLARCGINDTVTPAREASVILAEGLGTIVFINQIESALRRDAAAELAALVPQPVLGGSLYQGVYFWLH
jgi:probable selenium-dependent hydroxylase accessory protein YqeC